MLVFMGTSYSLEVVEIYANVTLQQKWLTVHLHKNCEEVKIIGYKQTVFETS